jgi:YbbR domain-containing protein
MRERHTAVGNQFEENGIANGLQDDLNKLNASDLAASIDASRLSEGTHQVELSLKLDEDHYAYQPITVSVTVKAKNTQDGDTSTDSGEDTGE